MAAVLLGLVEGFTEFLPVSSTGHLILAGHLLGRTGEEWKLFEVFIQLGAILAVVVAHFRVFAELFSAPEKGKGFSGYNGFILLGLTTLPALLAGRLAYRFIKTHLFCPETVAAGLAAGAIWILLVERRPLRETPRGLDDLDARAAFLIGLFQCLALWPGMSRATCTILGALMLGFDRASAVRYSFFAAVPLMLFAVAYDLMRNAHLLDASSIGWFLTGFGVAFVSALAAIQFFIRWVSRHGLAPFAWYRLAVAALTWLLVR